MAFARLLNPFAGRLTVAWAAACAVVLLLARNVAATPPGFRVACVSQSSGEVLWRSQRADLPRPLLSAEGGLVVVRDAQAPKGGVVTRLVLESGVEAAPGAQAVERPFYVIPRLPLPHQLSATTQLLPDAGRTLTVQVGTQAVPLVTLEGPAQQVAALPGEHIVAIMDGASGLGVRVLAVDLRSRALLWEVDLRRRFADIQDDARVGMGVDGKDVVVAAAGWVARLDGNTGEFLWASPLPRAVMPYRATETPRVGKDTPTQVNPQPVYYVSAGDVLAAYQAATGEVLWTYVGGTHAQPWPLRVEDRLLMAWQDQREPRALPAGVRTPGRPNVVTVTRDAHWLGGYRADFLQYAAVKHGRVLSPLDSPPPSQTDRAGKRVILHLVEGGSNPHTGRVDVTAALMGRGRVLVRLGPQVDKVLLMDGPRQVFSAPRPQ